MSAQGAVSAQTSRSATTGRPPRPQQIEREGTDEVLRREQYFRDRRAGGHDKKIQKTDYDRSIQQMLHMEKDRGRFTTSSTLPSWVDVSKGGESNGGTYESGRAVQVAFDPTNDNIMYLASAGGGIWKTTDDGTTWVPLTDHLPTSSCGAIAVDPNHPETIYYASGEENFSLDSYYGEGIFKSTDGGNSWTKITAQGVGSYYAQIVIDPANSNILYVANDIGIFKSTNGGLNWALKNAGPGNEGNAECIVLNPLNSNTMYATFGGPNPNAAEKSTDGGATWTALSGYAGAATGRTQLAIAPSDTNYIYGASTRYYYPPDNAPPVKLSNGGVYLSTDGGNSWTQGADTNYMGAQDWYDNVITVNPSNKMDVVLGGLDIFESTDGGQSVKEISPYGTPPHPDIHCLIYHGNYLYACTDGGLYRTSNDGSTWLALNRTLSTLEYQGADYAAGNQGYLLGGMQDNGKSKTVDAGSDVIVTLGGDGGALQIDPSNTNIVYGSYYDNTLHRSNDGGTSWNSMYPSSGTGGLFYPPFELAPSITSRIVYGLADVWENQSAQTTFGSGWIAILAASQSPGNCSAIAISTTNPNKMYLGFDAGQVMVTTNNGTTWNSTPFGTYIGGIAVDPANDSVAYATLTGFYGTHVYKTSNSGATWTNITNNLPNTPVNSIIVRSYPPRMLVVGSDIGVFNSTDDGAHWAALNNGLPISPIFDLKYRENDKILLAATHGRGLWEYNLGAYTFAASTNSLPFGSVAYTSVKAETLMVTNGGAVTLNISNVSTNDSEFTVTPTTASINAGSSFAFVVTYRPSSAGPKSATLTFTDDGITSPDQVGVTGTGVASTFSANASVLNFSNVRVGQNKTDSVSVTNTGNAMLHLAVAANDSEFQVTPAIDSIPASAAHEFHVVFTPASIGPKSAAARFVTDSPNSPDTVLLVGGGGVATIEVRVFRDSASQLNPSRWGISLYQDSVSAGTLIASGTSADFPFVVVSAGTYIAVEADSGNIIRENGNGESNDTLIIANNTTVVDTFINRYFSVSVATFASWNMVSTADLQKDSSLSGVFPSADDDMFEYDSSGYNQVIFFKRGVGYWVKFPARDTTNFHGTSIASVDVSVFGGWNMIGAISKPIPVSEIGSTPPGLVASLVWGYNQGYVQSDTLYPGKAYWVNVHQSGVLQIPASNSGTKIIPKPPSLDGLNQLIVTDAKGNSQMLYFGESARTAGPADDAMFRMPPSAPAGTFDARFTNGSFAAISPFAADRHGTLDISLTSASYPVSVEWKLSPADQNKYALTGTRASSGGLVSLKGLSGSTTIRDSKVKIISVGLAASDLPRTYALEQNYPNPFNPSTVIKYELPSDSRVTLRIFNVLGEEIATLVAGTQAAGFKSVTWNGLGRNANAEPSGVYFYRLEATSIASSTVAFVQMKKMIFVK